MLLVRERAPLRLDVDIATPDNHHARWGLDERSPANVPGGLTFSSTMPGGFEAMSCVLERRPELDYADLEELSTITVRGVGGQVAWQGRLERTPRVSGDQLSVAPAAVGWQAHLDDDASAREIYLDASQARWQGASVQRKIDLTVGGWPNGADDPSVAPDASTGAPSLETAFNGAFNPRQVAEGWYDAQGISLGTLYYAWKKNANVNAADASWSWQAFLSSDDVASAVDASAQLRAAGPDVGSITATSSDRKFALVEHLYNSGSAAGADGVQYSIFWTFLALTGRSGIPIQGTLGATGGIGVLASDVIANAIGRWAPKLSFSTGADGSIRPSTFVIPQLVFTDPTTVSQIIKAATAFGLPDWGVFDGPGGIPTFYCADRGTFAKHWRARVYPAKLQETGPQVDRLWNGVLVSFTDISGITRTVGPPGSGANTEDASLLDSDPLNPVNEAGIRRYTPLQMGTSTAAGAIKVGATFLTAQKELNSSGQASFVGHVEDDHGVLWPAWKPRAGDDVSFVDAHDSSPRRIVQAAWDDSSKTMTVQLDAPPQGLEWLLARLGASVQPLGY